MTANRKYIIAGALITGALAFLGWVAMRYEDLQTGILSLDRPGIRARILAECIKRGWGIEIAKRLMGICHQESGGNPNHYIGDVNLPGGPSIGPMQVYYKSAVDYGLIPSDVTPADYAAMASDEGKGIAFGCQIFAFKLKAANGDLDEAVRRYNGSGPAAENYRDSVLAFVADTFTSGANNV